MFNHIDISLPKLEREEIDGVRYYKVPGEGNLSRLVSITSVTSFHNRHIFDKWRKKVGEAEANKVNKQATSRGTDMHTLTENYLLNVSELPKVQPLSQTLFKIAKPELNKINNIYALEGALYSKVLGIAGTVDCIAEYKGKLSVIDFKTSRRVKTRDDIHDYFIQCSAYAVAFEEMTGKPVSRLVVIMGVDNEQPLIFQERRDDWVSEFKKLRAEYKRIKGI